MKDELDMKTVMSHCKEYGFIFPGSEIYGGLANAWDYGPVGCELKYNVRAEWWKKFVQESENSYGVDAAILMNPRVWEASGHLQSFSDPKIECKKCHERFRADHLVEKHSHNKINGDSLSVEELDAYINEHGIHCPTCGSLEWTPVRQFNLMFKTFRGVVDDEKGTIYLRPETAQGEYVNFLAVQRAMRLKVPFGIAQVGKAFRNEITPGNFTFRTIEFDQMEHQWFCHKGEDEKYYDLYKQKATEFFLHLGLKQEDLRFKDHEKLAHYAKAACDTEFKFPFGWGEINGTHNRTDYDLSRHTEFSGKNQAYTDPITGENYVPYVVESTYGLDRITLALICAAYDTEEVNGETRIVLRFKPSLAPFKVAVLPLIKKTHDEKANEIYLKMTKVCRAAYDERGSIGKRYRRQDAIGTPFCVTIDDETLNNGTVTVRERDSMQQTVVKVEELESFIKERI